MERSSSKFLSDQQNFQKSILGLAQNILTFRGKPVENGKTLTSNDPKNFLDLQPQHPRYLEDAPGPKLYVDTNYIIIR